MATTRTEPVGVLVRRWRTRRRRSQLDVSLGADLSARHLSFIETGRATPSRPVIERLCDELDVPLRERNAFYLGAGYAPVHPERPFGDLGAARTVVETVLSGHEPNPALAVNVRWEMLAANQAMALFLTGLPAHLSRPPVNVLRATLHPEGLASRIRNLSQWRAHVLRRVRRQLARTAAEGLAELVDELATYPEPAAPAPPSNAGSAPAGDPPVTDLAIPLRMTTDHGDLALLYTTTVFGAPRDVTVDEIAIETFFPADPHTATLLRSLATAGSP